MYLILILCHTDLVDETETQNITKYIVMFFYVLIFR